MEADRQQRAEREGFFGAAKVVAGMTMLSRVLGMVRDMAIWRLGADRVTDSFWLAFTIPNLFRRLFAEGALSAAFVPVFTEVSEAAGWERARAVLANAAGLLAVLLATLVVIGEVGIGLWLWLGAPPADWELLGRLTMIVLPFMFTICLLALGSAALNCKGHFAYPAFTPILLNVFLIAATAVGYCWFGQDKRPTFFLLSASVIAAGATQLVGVIWLLRSVNLAVVPTVRPVLPEVRRVAKLMLPMMVPLGVLQLSAFFDRFYAGVMSATPGAPQLGALGMTIDKPLTEGVVTWLYAANRLYQFPLGILAISVATVVFPLFSRYAKRGDMLALRQATNRALRLSLFAAIPAGVGLLLLAKPAVTLICRHGDYGPRSVAATADVLRMYCLGMAAYFCNHILLRAFFAQKDTRTPMRIACSLAGVNMLLVVFGVFTPLKAAAIGLASAITQTINVLLLVWVLRRRWGRIGGRQLIASVSRTAAATVAMAAAVIAAAYLLAPTAEALAPKAGAGIVLAAAIPAGIIAFATVALLLRCPELSDLLRRRKAPSTE